MTTILNPAALAAKSNEAKAMRPADENLTSAFADTLQASAAEDTALEHVPAPTAPAYPIADPASYSGTPVAPQAATQPAFTPKPTQTPATSLPGLPGGSVSPQTAISLEAAKTVVLTVPVTVHGVTITEVHLREATFGDEIDMGVSVVKTLAVVENGINKIEMKTDYQAATKWFVRLSGLDRQFFREMKRTDGRAIMEALQILTGENTDENF